MTSHRKSAETLTASETPVSAAVAPALVLHGATPARSAGQNIVCALMIGRITLAMLSLMNAIAAEGWCVRRPAPATRAWGTVDYRHDLVAEVEAAPAVRS